MPITAALITAGIGGAVGLGTSIYNANTASANAAAANQATAGRSAAQEIWANMDATTAWQRQEASREAQQGFQAEQAGNAFERQKALWQMQADYNSNATNTAWERQQALLGAQQGFSREQTAEQERYNSQQANTVYQRGVNDMRAAGINPMLAIMKGGDPAASVSPMGANAGSVQAASVGGAPGAAMASGTGPGSAPQARAASALPAQAPQNMPIGNFVSSGLEAYQAVTGIQKALADIKNTNQETATGQAVENLNRAQAAFQAAGTAKAQQDILESQTRQGQIDPSARAQQQRDVAAAGASAAQAALSAATTKQTEQTTEREKDVGRGPLADVLGTIRAGGGSPARPGDALPGAVTNNPVYGAGAALRGMTDSKAGALYNYLRGNWNRDATVPNSWNR